MYHMTAAECSKAYVSQCIICFYFLTQKNHVERRKKSDRYLPCHIFGAKIQTGGRYNFSSDIFTRKFKLFD